MGTRSATGSLKAEFKATIKNVLWTGETGPPSSNITANPTITLTSGTGDDQFDRAVWQEDRSLTGSNQEDWDLYDLASFDVGAGAGKDNLGQTWGCAEVVGILIENQSGSAGTLLAGGKGTTAAWNSWCNSDDDAKITIPPGGFWLLAAPDDGSGYAVADTSNHLLQIDASGGNITYNIYIAARSA